MTIALALVLAISSQATAEPLEIHFPAAKTVTIVQGSVGPTRPVVYLVQGRKGQRFDLRLVRNTASAVFSLETPGGEPVPEQEYDGVTRLSGQFGETGRYRITVAVVDSDPREAEYALRVSVR